MDAKSTATELIRRFGKTNIERVAQFGDEPHKSLAQIVLEIAGEIDVKTS